MPAPTTSPPAAKKVELSYSVLPFWTTRPQFIATLDAVPLSARRFYIYPTTGIFAEVDDEWDVPLGLDMTARGYKYVRERTPPYMGMPALTFDETKEVHRLAKEQKTSLAVAYMQFKPDQFSPKQVALLEAAPQVGVL